MSSKKKKKNSIFSKIETREEALNVIKECAATFLGIAIISGIVGLWLFPSMLIDAFLFTVFGLALMYLRSRIVAIILLILSGFVVLTTLMNSAGLTNAGGSNVFLALVIFWAGIRAVTATFKLHGEFATESSKFENDSTIEYQDFDASFENQSLKPSSSGSNFTQMEWILIAILMVLILFVLGGTLLIFAF